VKLPFQPPIAPMLAKLQNEIPEGANFIFEPKWDGFRALVFRDGDDVQIQSRDLKPLQRYFPELAAPLREQLPERCVLDGEIVIAQNGALQFEALLQRIHPAESRIKMLSQKWPASYVAWDILALGDEDLREKPQKERRAKLEGVLGKAQPPIYMTPATRDRELATDWFNRFEGAGLDGVVAKDENLVYSPGKRTMLKIKHERTIECAVAGFRWYKDKKNEAIGSLLLGLYDAEGHLQHIGVTSSFALERRKELVKELEPLRENAKQDHPWASWVAEQREDGDRKPGMKSRWNAKKDLSWEPLRVERVCEVSFDHMQGRRFRHTSHFKRWRPDKPPKDCTYEQLDVTPPYEVAKIFGAT
jgi:ATP-dependent DNA ligase